MNLDVIDLNQLSWLEYWIFRRSIVDYKTPSVIQLHCVQTVDVCAC